MLCYVERRVICVSGPTGCGKSTCAAAVKAHLAERAPGGVVYDGSDILRKVASARGRMLRIDGEPPVKTTCRHEAFSRELQAERGADWMAREFLGGEAKDIAWFGGRVPADYAYCLAQQNAGRIGLLAVWLDCPYELCAERRGLSMKDYLAIIAMQNAVSTGSNLNRLRAMGGFCTIDASRPEQTVQEELLVMVDEFFGSYALSEAQVTS